MFLHCKNKMGCWETKAISERCRTVMLKEVWSEHKCNIGLQPTSGLQWSSGFSLSSLSSRVMICGTQWKIRIFWIVQKTRVSSIKLLKYKVFSFCSLVALSTCVVFICYLTFLPFVAFFKIKFYLFVCFVLFCYTEWHVGS